MQMRLAPNPNVYSPKGSFKNSDLAVHSYPLKIFEIRGFRGEHSIARTVSKSTQSGSQSEHTKGLLLAQTLHSACLPYCTIFKLQIAKLLDFAKKFGVCNSESEFQTSKTAKSTFEVRIISGSPGIFRAEKFAEKQ